MGEGGYPPDHDQRKELKDLIILLNRENTIRGIIHLGGLYSFSMCIATCMEMVCNLRLKLTT
jgi:hypothetical protein